MKFLIILIALSVSSLGIIAQNTDNSWKFNGQALIRPELDGRDFSNLTYPHTYTGMRFRIGVEKTFFENMQLFVQFQDSRYWGQEGAPTKDISNTDLHQGFVKINNIFDNDLYVKAGRFYLQYDDQRIFGSSQWNLPSRSFDGMQFGYDTKNTKIDAFALTANWSGVPATAPGAHLYPAPKDTSFSLYGIYSQFNLESAGKLDVYGYWEANRKQTNGSNPDMNRYTFGALYKFNFNDFFGKIAGVYQTGTQRQLDIAAYLAILNLGYDFGDIKVSANADISSGNNPNRPANQTNLFDAAFTTKHGIQGFMDYFTNISNSTLNGGLNDLFLRLLYNQQNSPFTAQLDIHNFTTNQKVTVNVNNTNMTMSAFGQEIDLQMMYQLNKSTSLEWGASVFLPDELMKQIWKAGTNPNIIREDMAFWSYLALKVNLN